MLRDLNPGPQPPKMIRPNPHPETPSRPDSPKSKPPPHPDPPHPRIQIPRATTAFTTFTAFAAFTAVHSPPSRARDRPSDGGTGSAFTGMRKLQRSYSCGSDFDLIPSRGSRGISSSRGSGRDLPRDLPRVQKRTTSFPTVVDAEFLTGNDYRVPLTQSQKSHYHTIFQINDHDNSGVGDAWI